MENTMRLGAYRLGSVMTLFVLAAACTAATAEDEEEASDLHDAVVITDGLSPDALGTPSNGATTVPSNGAPTAPLSGALTMLSDWGSGYCANISISSQGTKPTTSWTVVLDLKQSTLSSLWNAESSENGSILTVRPPLRSATGLAGAPTSFGFCANATGKNYRPAVISVNPGGS
jgi:cellulase/cellobiase CelA1